MRQREHDDPRSILTDVEKINEIFQEIAAHHFDPGFGSIVQRFLNGFLVGIELKVYAVGGWKGVHAQFVPANDTHNSNLVSML
jgi:hypothetical protein